MFDLKGATKVLSLPDLSSVKDGKSDARSVTSHGAIKNGIYGKYSYNNFEEIINDILDPSDDSKTRTLSEAGIVSEDRITCNFNDLDRRAFDLPPTINIAYKPPSDDAEEASFIGMSIIAKL